VSRSADDVVPAILPVHRQRNAVGAIEDVKLGKSAQHIRRVRVRAGCASDDSQRE